MDLFEKCKEFTRAREAMEAGYYPYFIPLDQTEGTEVIIGGKRLIMIGSNNYLGLTTHPKVRQAAIDAVREYGTSCTGSRFLNGNLMMHKELEARLAAYVRKEAALVFSTGFQSNLGGISALVGRGDVVITDREDHASIIDGCRLSYGVMKRFRHNDMADLERVLAASGDVGKLVVVDGVFSMGGDIAPLPQIVPLCKKHGARLMVDDAHSIGVLGGGRGTGIHFGLNDDVDLIMGTFSKSFASLGGFLAGSEEVIHYIQHAARSLIFSASMPPSNTAAVLAALDVMESEPERIERLWAIAAKMRQGYQQLGFDTGKSETPVIPIYIGDDMLTIFAWKTLFDAGIYTNPVIPPGVSPGQSLLRTSYMATHTDEQLDRVLATFEQVGKELELI
ncbi:MAG TPA: pyridoxal phosphate-dependent aminotransferase family protein [Anaerolineae bacterium]|nr:pyridoxal phosphate-dependent aminotransferase family protein [Anaerolineae bacterium]HOQ97815.1 pyridoxal phosphate-dependent aminotransferase family protein [Anaerolineae bacterium]HPL30938.1 pyridoxal phosphate-dependent aminotransferase family protein [Anaerolineae bacterium]